MRSAPVPRRFRQVDVFAEEPGRGNPVAVVLDANGLDDATMQRFANWTNLSETTFVLPPTTADADYRVRIFTPSAELPFAGHPTLGTCHAWLAAGGRPANLQAAVQECGAGLVRVRLGSEDGGATGEATGGATGGAPRARLAFAAPPLVRSGAVEPGLLARVVGLLGLDPADVVDAAWVDNGPGWMALLLPDAEAVLAVEPGPLDDLFVGVVGPHPPGSPTTIEVRGFFPVSGSTVEDPVTGSLHASLAQWLVGAGRLAAPYVATQGTRLGRAGRIHVEQDPDGTIWVGGSARSVVEGTVHL
ncbi:MAG: PhzF family phenazine biosynthesis protein [Kineosporiaceae bacterium]